MSRWLERRCPAWGPRLVLLVGLAVLGDAARAGVTTSPAGRKLRLRVGQTQHFIVAGQRILCFWRMDGHTIPGALPEWSFTPTPTQVGRHRLTVDVHEPAGLTHRAWALRVDPASPPRVVGAAPEAPALEVGQDESFELSLRTRPGAPGERIHTAWTVDGVPVGEGDTLRLVPPRTGTIRARALATGSLGSAVAREWEINVRPTVLAAATPTTVPRLAAAPTTVPAPAPVPTTTPPPAPVPTTVPPPPPVATTTPPVPTTSVPPTTVPAPVPTTVPPPAPTTTLVATTTTSVATPRASTTSLPPARTTTTTTPIALAAVSTTTTLPEPPPERLASLPPPATEPPPASRDGITPQDVRLLLQRYASAWNRHDVDELRRLGQVATEQQAAALRDYFGRVGDLEVEVELLDLTVDGDRHTVRFTRRDRFRDPGGRVVSKETPPIEKDVVRSGGGLRFVAPAR